MSMYTRVTNVKYQEQLDYDNNDSSWAGKYRYDPNEYWWTLFVKEDKLACVAYDGTKLSMNDSTDSGYYLIMDSEEQAYGVIQFIYWHIILLLMPVFVTEPNDVELWTLSDY
ncbi:hypothetical protein BDR04DRAFT_1117688 [Suillus decipiens]|nr:hypothetical protein BDR04DRAFT_1117688 [Suillus decipiens]